MITGRGSWCAVACLVAGLAGCPRPGGPLPTPPAVPEAPQQTPEPRAVLERGAGSVDPSTRGRALAWLVRLDRAPAGGEWAQRGLWDPQPWVQRQVVEALADRLGEPETVEVLVGYVGRSSAAGYVRATAALHLVDGGHSAAVREPLAAAWRAASRAYEQAPLALAAAGAGDDEAVEALASALSRGAVGLELPFLQEVGRSGLEGLIPALQQGADHIEPELALPYAGARLGLGDDQATGVLRKALAGDPDRALVALDVLAGLPGPASTGLIGRARDDGGLVGWYARLILAVRGEADPETFVRATTAEPQEARVLAQQYAAKAAGEVDERTLRRAVRLGLSDADPIVRLAALRALPALGVDGEEPWLRRALGDDDPALRLAAAAALLSR